MIMHLEATKVEKYRFCQIHKPFFDQFSNAVKKLKIYRPNRTESFSLAGFLEVTEVEKCLAFAIS